MKRTIELLAYALCTTVITMTSPSFACSCRPLSVESAKSDAAIIFSGTVKSIRYVDPQKDWEPRVVVTFDVAKVWKGDVPKTFAMYSNAESSMCEGFFQEFLVEGKQLLIYGSKNSLENWKKRSRGTNEIPADLAALPDAMEIYSTNICTRSRYLEDAKEDLTILGSPLTSFHD